MKPFALLAERPARWTSPMRWKRRFELAAGDDVFASLDFEKACGTLVVARDAPCRARSFVRGARARER